MDLLHYIKGFRKGKNAHHIEKEAMTDSFLSDALDGYESVEGNHIETVSRLQQKILGQTKKKNHSRIWWAAACAVLVTGISVYVFFPEQEKIIVSQEIQKQESNLNVSEIDADANKELLSEGELQAESKQLKMPQVELLAAEGIEYKDADACAVIQSDMPAESRQINAEQVLSDKIVENQVLSDMPADVDYIKLPVKEKTTTSKKTLPVAIKGQVVDNSTGEPILGASVLLKGTSIGAITDSGGYFDLRIDSVLSKYNDLNVSYIGYEPQNIHLKNKNEHLAIALHESTQTLSEVVVVGMGAKRKKDTSYSASSELTDFSSPAPTIGMKEYIKYLNKNTVQPTDKDCAAAKGKVKLSFYVNSSGKPYNIKVEKSLCPSCDQKAIELIENGPDWTFGTKIVKIDITFKGK